MARRAPPEPQELEGYIRCFPDGLADFHADYTAADYARVVWNIQHGQSPERGIAASRLAARWEEISQILVEHGVIVFDQYHVRWELPDDLVERLPDS
jgi:hypothetical protein